MEEKIIALELKVDKLQATLEWMIEGMARARSIVGEPVVIPDSPSGSFIGGGALGQITTHKPTNPES